MKEIIQNKNGTFQVLYSHRTGYYTINLAGFCSCAGFGYRRKCRHIDLLKRKGLLKKEKPVIRSTGFAGTKTIPKYIRDNKGFRIELVEVK